MCSDAKIFVNLSQVEIPKNYIARKLIKIQESPTSLSLEEFIEKTRNDDVVLISGEASSGKTTLLKKIYHVLLKKFQKNWISFITSKNILKHFPDDLNSNLIPNLTNMLSLDELSSKVFKQSFENGEVKFLFDDFDELSLEDRIKTVNLIKIIKEKNQVFITSRTNFKTFLEKELQCYAYTMSVLHNQEQVKFLTELWKKKSPNHSEMLIEKCAFVLIERVSKLIESNSNFDKFSLLMKGITTAFNDKICFNFEEKIRKLTAFEIFSEIILEKFKSPCNLQDPYSTHAFIAIHNLLDEELAQNLLSTSSPDDDRNTDDITFFELVFLDKNEKLQFYHDFHAEIFVCQIFIKLFKNKKNLPESKFELFIKILSKEKLQLTRLLLDEIFESNKIVLFTSSEHFHKALMKSEIGQNVLNLAVSEGHTSLFMYVLHLLRDNIELYETILMKKSSEESNPYFLEILSKIVDKEIMLLFLKEIFSNDEVSKRLINYKRSGDTETAIISTIPFAGFEESLKFILDKIDKLAGKDELKKCFKLKYLKVVNESSDLPVVEFLWRMFEDNLEKDDLIKILQEKNENGDNFLHLIAKLVKSSDICQFLMLKIKQLINDLERFNTLLLVKNKQNLTALSCSIKKVNRNSFAYLFKEVYYIQFNHKQLIEDVDEDGENFLHLIIRSGSIHLFECALNQFSKASQHELDKIVNNELCNLLHIASQSENEQIMSRLIDLIPEDKVKTMLITADANKYLPLHHALEWSSEKYVKFLFNIYEKFLESSQIKNIFFTNIFGLTMNEFEEKPIRDNRNIVAIQEITSMYRM